jgi:hypothetical protein
VRGVEIGSERRIHPDEPVHLLHGGDGVPLEITRKHHVQLLAREALVVPNELGMVVAELHPARIRLGPGSCWSEVARRVEGAVSAPDVHQVVRIRALHRVAETANEPRTGDHRPDPVWCLRALKVDRRRLPDGRCARRTCEQRLVLAPGFHRKPVDVWIAVEQAPRFVQAVGEIEGLLHRTHEHVGVLGAVPVQRRRTGLRGSNDDEGR